VILRRQYEGHKRERILRDHTWGLLIILWKKRIKMNFHKILTPDWFIGFVDGEGSFVVSIVKNMYALNLLLGCTTEIASSAREYNLF